MAKPAMNGLDELNTEPEIGEASDLPGYLIPPVFRLNKFLIQIFLVTAISLFVIYLIFRNQEIGNLFDAIASSHQKIVLLALIVVSTTILAKSVRWKIILDAFQAGNPLIKLFRAFSIGLLINLVIPLRLGDAIRAFAATQGTDVKLGQSIVSVMVEKTLDLLALLVVSIFLLTTITLPSNLRVNSLQLLPGVLFLIGSMILLAYKSESLVRWHVQIVESGPKWAQSLARWQPIQALSSQIENAVVALASLRSPSTVIKLLLSTSLVTLLAILTPALLFAAFDFPLGFLEATALNLVLSIGSLPPSTPGKILVFESLTILTLAFFGVDTANRLLGYAIVYHAVVAIPSIVAGALSIAIGGIQLPGTSLIQN